jgi:hypothetical protein
MTNETKQTAVDIAIQKCYQAIVDSRNPDTTTKRGGDYRIGLRKAIDILEELKEMEKEQKKLMFDCGRQYQLTGEGTFTEVYNETYGGNK